MDKPDVDVDLFKASPYFTRMRNEKWTVMSNVDIWAANFAKCCTFFNLIWFLQWSQWRHIHIHVCIHVKYDLAFRQLSAADSLPSHHLLCVSVGLSADSLHLDPDPVFDVFWRPLVCQQTPYTWISVVRFSKSWKMSRPEPSLCNVLQACSLSVDSLRLDHLLCVPQSLDEVWTRTQSLQCSEGL